jgi:hypothetical protein
MFVVFLLMIIQNPMAKTGLVSVDTNIETSCIVRSDWAIEVAVDDEAQARAVVVHSLPTGS